MEIAQRLFHKEKLCADYTEVVCDKMLHKYYSELIYKFKFLCHNRYIDAKIKNLENQM